MNETTKSVELDEAGLQWMETYRQAMAAIARLLEHHPHRELLERLWNMRREYLEETGKVMPFFENIRDEDEDEPDRE